MTKWLVKREVITFDYNDPNITDRYVNELHNFIAAQGQEGWEPWHIVGGVFGSTETIIIWFKKPQRDSQ